MPFPAAAHAIREYHKVHVTMIAGVVDPSYFGRTDDTLPNLIVTTGTPLSKSVVNCYLSFPGKRIMDFKSV